MMKCQTAKGLPLVSFSHAIFSKPLQSIDSPKGNEFSGDYFFCATVSDDLYVFDAQDWSFGTRDTLPRQRYRHCGEVINNQLWLLGGRDVDDGLLSEVDVC
jgi:hypothetical protein